MNSKRDFDRAVDQWLDEGSDATPPEVIDAVLLAVRSTPQERDLRAPWRTTPMTSYLRVAAVIALAVIAGTAAIVTFGPGGSRFGGTNATPSPSPVLLARGNFFEHDAGEVEFEAVRVGSSVTGHMAIASGFGEALTDSSHMVDLQCVRETEDGIVMIGGYITNEAGNPLAGIVLKRGSHMKAHIYHGPAQTGDCLAFLDAWLEDSNPSGDDWEPLNVIDGAVEFGP